MEQIVKHRVQNRLEFRYPVHRRGRVHADDEAHGVWGPGVQERNPHRALVKLMKGIELQSR
jgi:hypothetical protein